MSRPYCRFQVWTTQRGAGILASLPTHASNSRRDEAFLAIARFISTTALAWRDFLEAIS